MFRPFRSPPHARVSGLLAGLVVGSLLTSQVALAEATPPVSVPSPAASPVVVVTPRADDESLLDQLSSDDDVVLVAGVAAVTVLGLAGLARLDRRPPVSEQDGGDFD